MNRRTRIGIIVMLVLNIVGVLTCTVLDRADTEQRSHEIPTVVQAVAIDRGNVERHYDIALSNELQDFTKNQAGYEEVPYQLVLAVMEQESGFNPDAISKTHDYGIMQINESNFNELKDIFGYEDFMNPQNNIVCGTYILSNEFKRYAGDLDHALMAYNLGERKADEYWNSGIHSTKYSSEVIARYETYRTGTVARRR